MRKSDDPVVKLYDAVVARARDPVFYTRWRAADTIDGRFDLVALHAFLVFDALRDGGEAASEMAAGLADAVFTGFDEALRELGVSDFGMGRRMRKLADAFYGRVQSYGEARDAASLAAALQRNLYRGDPARAREAEAMASYMFQARDCLRRNMAGLISGKPDFGPLPQRVDIDE